jgi:hypothetical protein
MDESNEAVSEVQSMGTGEVQSMGTGLYAPALAISIGSIPAFT